MGLAGGGREGGSEGINRRGREEERGRIEGESRVQKQGISLPTWIERAVSIESTYTRGKEAKTLDYKTAKDRY